MNSWPAKALTISLSLFVCCGATSGSCNNSNSNFNIGPSTGEVVGATVAVGAVIATAIIVPVEINKHQHNIQGCVYTTPNGLELRTSDQKVYVLSGATANVSPGTTVRLHGDRQKHDKNSSGDQVFLVKEIKKSSGPCTVLNASTPASAASPSNPGTAGQTQP